MASEENAPQSPSDATLTYHTPEPPSTVGRSEARFALVMALAPFVFLGILQLHYMSPSAGNTLGIINLVFSAIFGSLGVLLAVGAGLSAIVMARRLRYRIIGAVAIVICVSWAFVALKSGIVFLWFGGWLLWGWNGPAG